LSPSKLKRFSYPPSANMFADPGTQPITTIIRFNQINLIFSHIIRYKVNNEVVII